MVTVTRGAHRDPRDSSAALLRWVAAPELRRTTVPGGLRRLLANPAVRRVAAEPRVALVVALLAVMVLVTGKAHNELADTAGRLPSVGPVADSDHSAPGGPIVGDPGAGKPRERAPAATGAPAATRRPGAPAPATSPGQGTGRAPRGSTGGRPDPSASAVGRVPAAGPAGSIRRTGTSAVALTFDDGPDPVNTPKLLDLLRQHRVKATFCVVGSRALAHPDLVRRIAAEGHTLCNHSWNHSFELGLKPAEKIREDLDRTNAAIRAAVPDARIGYFRAPGGFFTEPLVGVARDAGMSSLYWEVDPRDWDHPLLETAEEHVERVVRVVEQETRPGSMILSHDFQQPLTIAAYQRLLPWLNERFGLIALPPPAAALPATPAPAGP